MFIEDIQKMKAKRDVEGLITALKDEDEDYNVRKGAVEALVEIGKPAVESLTLLLKDQTSFIEGEAAKALGKIGDASAIEPLIRALKNEVWAVQVIAGEALGEIGDAKAVEPLIEVLEKGADDDVRGLAALALGHIGDTRAIEPLIKSLEDEDVRSNAAWALVKIGEPAVKSLIEVVNNISLLFREDAVRALGEIGDKRAIEPLNKALKDKDPEVCQAAKEALKELKKEK
jgi:HEAT repeat protein